MACSHDFDPAWLANPAMRDEELFQRLVHTLGEPRLDAEDEMFLCQSAGWSESTVSRMFDLIGGACERRRQVVRLGPETPEPP